MISTDGESPDVHTKPGTGTATKPVRAWYSLIILWLIFMFSCVDRFVLAVLVQPIKDELHLSDLEIGILTGFAFSIFYATLSLPIARLSDRGSRRRVITICLVLWSIATAICGLAQSFVQLVFARFAVGGAEAGVSPSLQASVPELFPSAFRNTALAFLTSGAAVGIMIALALGAWLEGVIGWRMTFILISLPSIPLAALYYFTVPDTQTRHARSPGKYWDTETFADLLRNRYFLLLCTASGLQMVLLTGVPQWLPAYFERSFGLPRSQIGGAIALTNTLGMLLGILAAGPLADRMASRSPVWPARIMLAATMFASVPAILIFRVWDIRIIFALLAIMGFLMSAPAGLLVAMMQDSVRKDQRAIGAAGLILASSFVGNGIAPAIIGLLSDLFAPAAGADSLRLALLTMVAVDAPILCLVLARIVQLKQRETIAKGKFGADSTATASNSQVRGRAHG